jgi:integrase
MLTNATVKAARPGARPLKMFDAGGLYLYVRPSGRRTWRMKYRHQRREKLLTFGDFPDMGLGDARELRDQARAQLRRGEDPAAAAAEAKAAAIASAEQQDVTFEGVARRWFERRKGRWSTKHAEDVIGSLERHVFPAIGARPVDEVTAPLVLSALQLVEEAGAIETARRLRPRISGVFRLAMLDGLVKADPAAAVTDELMPAPAQQRQPALGSIGEARELLAAVDQVDAGEITKLASMFLALTGVRLDSLRGALWTEFEDLDLDGTFVGPLRPLWRVPAARMKLTQIRKADPAADHLVPLSAQAVEILRELRDLGRGSELVFPGRGRCRPIGEAAIGDLYDRAGYAGRHVPHGWRATFSTILNERFPLERALIDQALAHSPKDKVEAAYNRAQQLARRRHLFQRWADLLLGA